MWEPENFNCAPKEEKVINRCAKGMKIKEWQIGGGLLTLTDPDLTPSTPKLALYLETYLALDLYSKGQIRVRIEQISYSFSTEIIVELWLVMLYFFLSSTVTV